MEAWNISYIYTVIFMMLINNILVYVLSRTPGFGKSERWILQLMDRLSGDTRLAGAEGATYE